MQQMHGHFIDTASVACISGGKKMKIVCRMGSTLVAIFHKKLTKIQV